jgi:hypothetical protein
MANPLEKKKSATQMSFSGDRLCLSLRWLCATLTSRLCNPVTTLFEPNGLFPLFAAVSGARESPSQKAGSPIIEHDDRLFF